MAYQIIVLDLDGTLTNSKKEITLKTKEALMRIQKERKTDTRRTAAGGGA